MTTQNYKILRWFALAELLIVVMMFAVNLQEADGRFFPIFSLILVGQALFIITLKPHSK